MENYTVNVWFPNEGECSISEKFYSYQEAVAFMSSYLRKEYEDVTPRLFMNGVCIMDRNGRTARLNARLWAALAPTGELLDWVKQHDGLQAGYYPGLRRMRAAVRAALRARAIEVPNAERQPGWRYY